MKFPAAKGLWLLLSAGTWSIFFLPQGLAAQLEVCPACPIATITQALQQAAPGDEIHVQSGLYREGAVRVDKSVLLKGEGRPVIDGRSQGHVLEIRADDVTVEGFVIRNSRASGIEEFAGVAVEDSGRCTIRDNSFRNNVYSVYLAQANETLVEGNDIIGNTTSEISGGNGIHLWYSRNVRIRDNKIRGHRDGLYLEFSGGARIEDNVSRDNIRYGLHFMYSSGNSYRGNSFIANQTGVAVMYSKNIEMHDNRFVRSWGRASYGLLLKDISDSVILENLFADNTVGVSIDGAMRIHFAGNDFLRNGWAVNVLGNAEDNIFTMNDFVSNYFNVATNARFPENRFIRNYWSDYAGYDLDRDGTGDVPFRPMKIFSLWVSRFPELVVLLGSPVTEFLEIAERTFPILTPRILEDAAPRMRPRVAGP